MVSSSFSQDEKTRLAVLRRFEGIDASPEAALDSITALVAWFFNAPISVIDLILHDRIIVKSLYGLEKAQVGRQAEWRADAIATDDVFCITNALEHPPRRLIHWWPTSSVCGFMPPRRYVLAKGAA
jgi:hypothetical protein